MFYGNDLANIQVVDTFPVDTEMLAIADIFECHFYISNALFRAPVFTVRHCRFPETTISEDWLFFGLHNLKKRHLPETTLLYRRHPSNVTTAPMPSANIRTVRTQTRIQRLLRCGLFPSSRDIELLDIVGYLSFKLKWNGGIAEPRPQVWLPWFRLLETKANAAEHWPRLKKELSALFERIVEHNSRSRYLNHEKLERYLKAVLVEAESASLR